MIFFNRLKNWLFTQNFLPKLFKTTILFCIFGFIPGSWLIGVPLTFLYGLYKKETIARAVVRSVRRVSQFWNDMSAEVGAYLSYQIVNNPIKLIKLLTSFFLFATMSMPFSILGIYGLYRYTTEQWQASFGRFLERSMRFFTVGVAGTLERMSFNKKLISATIFAVSMALFAQSGGPLFLLELGFMAAQYALVYVGITAFFRDAKGWFGYDLVLMPRLSLLPNELEKWKIYLTKNREGQLLFTIRKSSSKVVSGTLNIFVARDKALTIDKINELEHEILRGISEKGHARLILSKPISKTTDHMGKILGALWGRWLAYEIFTGTITGSLGPAIGQVRTQGLVSGLIPAFLSPRNGWFTLNSGYVSVIMSRISTFFNSVISGLFFSHNMRLWGDFQGFIGPNSFQIFALMIIGGLIGYGTEKFVNMLYESLRDDSLEVIDASKPKIKSVKDQLHPFQGHLVYAAIASAIILASPGAAQIFALAGGSILGASILTVSAVGLALAGIYGAGYGMRNFYRRIRPEPMAARDGAVPAVVPSSLKESVVLPTPSPSFISAVEPLPTPSPSFTPAFVAVSAVGAESNKAAPILSAAEESRLLLPSL